MSGKALDVICLGRALVDLYGEQSGESLQQMSSFKKYLGGSSANMAVGMARLGLKSAMLTRVGDEAMGEFLRQEFAANGVDTSHVHTDPHRLTALALLGIKDRETFPLLFYRENCADMALSCDDFDEAFIASAKALLITGTHFSHADTADACRQALTYARRNQTQTVLDIDYRPVLWGLTARGLGEVRFVDDDNVTRRMQDIVPLFDLIVGTEEEIHIAGGATDTMQALRQIRALSAAVIVVKRGPLGCSVFPGDIPATLDDGIAVSGVNIEVFNVLGAGDAFISGFMRGWIAGDSYEQCCRYANACGALVVSRHGCAPAMPSRRELDFYLAEKQHLLRPDSDAALRRLHKVTTRRRQWRRLFALAFDHRTQFEQMALRAGADISCIAAAKALILRGLKQAVKAAGLERQAGLLLDSRFGEELLMQENGAGLWVARPVELPGVRPLQFETDGAGGGIGLELRRWPRGHVAKCLVYYHPDDPESLRQQQDRRLLELYQACAETEHELLLEVIPPAEMACDDATMAGIVAHFYTVGVYPDWWKLPPQSRASWTQICAHINACDPYCRGVVVLGLDAPEQALKDAFRTAAEFPLCKGFAVGRSIFSAPITAWFAGELDDAATVAQVADNYLRMVNAWMATDERRASAG